MFLLSAQNNFYIEFICRRACEKNSGLNLISLVGFQAFKIWMFSFGKFTVEQVLESFSGRNNSLKPLVFGGSNSLPFVVEESRELRSLGIQKCKMFLPTNFFCVFELPLWIY